ncbi:hypothetical protein [Flavobacterium crassostreae]|uniref:DUF3300 domain-containing protein n=1 Tax=Flavobacterium crassostreae TaxID=1763534 RepID=A0A1B9E2F9_9FLAO|nr:hypothetical protein [Flavobacterium crassostreae]OCB76116.1 hypothetical protein LPBF_07340 [Flavobacterium crassostreae]
MKNKLLFWSLAACVVSLQIVAQHTTQVRATSYEISANLDLRAVASIFGNSRDIADFERRLNDPEVPISNLDLNQDNQVDYLRVMETVAQKTHLISIQAVLGPDIYQDVATIDLEIDRYNRVQIQFVGNTFMFGSNYIYEPVYYTTPVIYGAIWHHNYRPYASRYYWNYYPTHYNAWNPYPVYRYKKNVYRNINAKNKYHYVNSRRSHQAALLHKNKYANGYERQHPEHAFYKRNATAINRYELDRSRRNPNQMKSRNEVDYNRNNTAYTPRVAAPKDIESHDNRSNRVRNNTTDRESNQRGHSPRIDPQYRPEATAPQRLSTTTNTAVKPQNNQNKRSSETRNPNTMQRTRTLKPQSDSVRGSREFNNMSTRSGNRRS